MSRKDWRTITIVELWKDANSNPKAKTALDLYLKIAAELEKRAPWAKPEIRYSPFHGYSVKDPLAIERPSN